MLNWHKGLFVSKKAEEGQATPATPATPAAPVAPAAPVEDMTGAGNEAAPESSEEVK